MKNKRRHPTSWQSQLEAGVDKPWLAENYQLPYAELRKYSRVSANSLANSLEGIAHVNRHRADWIRVTTLGYARWWKRLCWVIKDQHPVIADSRFARWIKFPFANRGKRPNWCRIAGSRVKPPCLHVVAREAIKMDTETGAHRCVNQSIAVTPSRLQMADVVSRFGGDQRLVWHPTQEWSGFHQLSQVTHLTGTGSVKCLIPVALGIQDRLPPRTRTSARWNCGRRCDRTLQRRPTSRPICEHDRRCPASYPS